MKILLVMILLGQFSVARSGQEKGGGKGIVCRGSQNEIKSIELLDIFEARLRGQNPIFNSDTVEKELSEILERTKYIFSREDKWVMDALTFSFSSFRECGYGTLHCGFIERIRGVELPETQDSFEGPLSLPPDCKLEQIAVYDHPADQHWTINMDLVDKMDKLNQAAFILHESLYSLLHSWEGEKNSLRVRRLVGMLMSGSALTRTADRLVKPYVQCAAYESSGEDDLYFMQDTAVKTPQVSLYANRIRYSELINFNNSVLTSSDINIKSNIEDFYKNLKSGNVKIAIQGSPYSVEFLSSLRFEMHGGLGTFHQDTLTGGGPRYASVENFKCTLVK
jgi:hypothetical protein